MKKILFPIAACALISAAVTNTSCTGKNSAAQDSIIADSIARADSIAKAKQDSIDWATEGIDSSSVPDFTTPDLTMFELKGCVKQCDLIETRDDFDKKETSAFTKDGYVFLGNDITDWAINHAVLTRDSQKRITEATWSIPGVERELGTKYTYNADGTIRMANTQDVLNQFERQYLYSKEGVLIQTIDKGIAEGKQYVTTKKIKGIKRDATGNWIERTISEVHKETGRDAAEPTTTTYVQTRIIKYWK